ncbi:MAG: hypothetical protein ACYTHK_09005 [Planctomycetota bacterium]|jgi:hypothetical protein
MRLLLLLLVTGCASSSQQASWLFVQNAERAELAGNKLTLTGVDHSVICFTDRPERKTGTIPTGRFIHAWEKEGVFKEVPPNATLAVFHENGIKDAVVVLRNPRQNGRIVTYDVEVLAGDPGKPGPAALFIDSVGSNTPPVRHGMHDEPGVIARKGMRIVDDPVSPHGTRSTR